MRATHAIAVETDSDLVIVTIGGFYDLAAVDAFAHDRDVAYQRLTCSPHRHLTLVDMRAMCVQTQAVVARFAALLVEPRWRSAAIAFVVSPTLARSQIARALDGREAGIFADLDAARHWLLDRRAALAA